MEGLAELIDSKLHFVRVFRYAPVTVLLVELRGEPCVLKAAPVCSEWGYAHLMQEYKVLRKAPMVRGITSLVRFYGEKNGYVSLLKTYFEGVELGYIDRISDTIASQLMTTLNELHSIGIGRFDIAPANIIVSLANQEARFVDLGYCVLREELNPNEFEEIKREDIESLESLLNPLS
ncbi:hypothetical protein KY318_03640 [Candidatus Woesearchaeota archaeon]|nr:hypothetical protein [Candidatus Woesearchaeota archaeon]